MSTQFVGLTACVVTHGIQTFISLPGLMAMVVSTSLEVEETTITASSSGLRPV
jgi:hypothetical protein